MLSSWEVEKYFFVENFDRKPPNTDGLRIRKQQRKRTMNIITWNVQGIGTEQREVFQEMAKVHIEVPTETKKKVMKLSYKTNTTISTLHCRSYSFANRSKNGNLIKTIFKTRLSETWKVLRNIRKDEMDNKTINQNLFTKKVQNA